MSSVQVSLNEAAQTRIALVATNQPLLAVPSAAQPALAVIVPGIQGPGGGSGGGGSGTVTSVGLSVPTGLVVTNSPVTSSGVLALNFATGYSLPTTAKQTDWDTAFADRLKWDGSSTGLNAATGRASLELGGAATLSVGTTPGTVAAGDDSRFTDARTPTAHKATHATGGSDALSPADIGAEVAGAASSAVSTHVGQADPHTQYALESNLAAVATSGAYSDLSGTPGVVTSTTAGLASAEDKQKIDIAVVSNVAGITGADAVTNIVSLTQAEYDAIVTPNASTLYVITD